MFVGSLIRLMFQQIDGYDLCSERVREIRYAFKAPL